MACKRYVAENRVSELENLVKITRDLFDVDRHMLYDHLLEVLSLFSIRSSSLFAMP